MCAIHHAGLVCRPTCRRPTWRQRVLIPQPLRQLDALPIERCRCIDAFESQALRGNDIRPEVLESSLERRWQRANHAAELRTGVVPVEDGRRLRQMPNTRQGVAQDLEPPPDCGGHAERRGRRMARPSLPAGAEVVDSHAEAKGEMQEQVVRRAADHGDKVPLFAVARPARVARATRARSATIQ